ncbi:TPA: hypothetical protein QDB05_004249 [Burkholderia vietnamiensis]|nr:hypothetical protein [Burkholderia vietnamiensis]
MPERIRHALRQARAAPPESVKRRGQILHELRAAFDAAPVTHRIGIEPAAAFSPQA